jgi:DNA-binding NarL/FixJ family response regulator
VHVLIIDVEFLVALESEQVLGDSLGCSAEIAVPRDAATAIAASQADVILIDTALLSDTVARLLVQRRRSGTGLVFSSVDKGDRLGIAQFPGAPVVFKPFDDEKLVEAVLSASQGEMA